MNMVSFDPFRSAGIPGVTYIKPELIFREKENVQNADWVLFPEYWQVNFLSYGWKKNIFPSIASYHLGHDKVEMTRAIQSVMPEHFPYTLIAGNTSSVKEQILDEFSFPFIAKEVRNSMGRGVHLITNSQELQRYLDSNEVVYIQEYLPIDRDMRVVYIGNRVVFAYWRVAQGGFKNNVAQGAAIDFSPVPQEVIERVETLASTLGVNHAGFDVALVDDHPYFFEFNVMFGTQALLQANIPLSSIIHEFINDMSEPKPPKPFLPTRKVS